jgi:hypothetical protein
MNTLHLTDEELWLVRNAMQSYLRAFGHDEADMLQAIKRVIAKLSVPTVEPPESSTELIG